MHERKRVHQKKKEATEAMLGEVDPHILASPRSSVVHLFMTSERPVVCSACLENKNMFDHDVGGAAAMW